MRNWTLRIDLDGYPVPYDLNFRIGPGNKVIVWNANSVYKNTTRKYLYSWMSNRRLDPLCGAIKLRIIVLTPRGHLPTRKPDASNLQKTIEDCCADILFGDDCAVTNIQTVKRQGATEGWRVRILVKSLPAGAG